MAHYFKLVVMRRSLFLFAGVLFSCFAQAQQPVQWNYSIKKITDTTSELRLSATIDAGWHIYSQTQPGRTISKPTKIEFTQNPLIHLEGKTEEFGQLDKHFEQTLGIVQYRYSNKVDFVQIIDVKSRVKMRITGTIAYQACTDEKCLPVAEVPFSVSL